MPIEIFKTKSKGWGVRATKNIKRGKVMGIYTGLISFYICEHPELTILASNLQKTYVRTSSSCGLQSFTEFLFDSRRDDVEKLPEEEKDYCFDLDGRENDKNENGGERYTVSSYTCGMSCSRDFPNSIIIWLYGSGNWTRFLKYVVHLRCLSFLRHSFGITAIRATRICRYTLFCMTPFRKYGTSYIPLCFVSSHAFGSHRSRILLLSQRGISQNERS